MLLAEIGPQEIIIIALVVLVLFGGAKIPQLARSLGTAKREFEKGATGEGKNQPDDPEKQA